MRSILLRMRLLDRKFINMIPRIFLISIACSALIEFSMILFEKIIRDPDPSSYGRIIANTLATCLMVLFWNAIYFTYHFFQKSRIQELNNLTLEASKNEIELKNLRSQLNPHFLFNSLNSIRALIDIEPDKAKHAVSTLSNLLRKSLIIGKENLVPLETELQMVSNYLELEKVRFEERLTIIWEIDDRLNSFLIPPFSLQMLVENAIKHGISNRMQGGEIRIISRRIDGIVEVVVENSGELLGTTDTGIGLINTRRRLDIQYKGSAEFTLVQGINNVVATLSFKNENI